MSVTHKTIIGHTFGENGAFGAIQQPKSVYNETGDGYTITETYRAFWDDWEKYAPRRGSPHPIKPYASLISRSATKIEPGYLCEVELAYEYKRSGNASGPDDPNSDPDQETPENPGKLPPDEISQNVASVTIPVERNPYFKDLTYDERSKIAKWLLDPDPAKRPTGLSARGELLINLRLEGIEHYIVPSVTENGITYSWGYPGSIENEIGIVSGGGKWLAISGSVFRQGNFWAKQIIRQYSPIGWENHLYPQ